MVLLVPLATVRAADPNGPDADFDGDRYADLATGNFDGDGHADLATGNFDGDGYADLAVGIPREDLELVPVTEQDAGAVQVLYGATDGLSGVGSQFWYQGAPIRDSAEEGDRFGYALAAIPRLRHYIYLPLVVRNYEP